MDDWQDVRKWRNKQRRRLVAARQDLCGEARQAAEAAITRHIHATISDLYESAIGFYWPFRGEFNCRPLMKECVNNGAHAALPVIEREQAPLAFKGWRPETKMTHGIWNIPVPQNEASVEPEMILVPLVGFDSLGFRLGNGGGYYDRTLAALKEQSKKPLTVGVGFEFCRLETIYPQAHDMLMDMIITDESCFTKQQR